MDRSRTSTRKTERLFNLLIMLLVQRRYVAKDKIREILYPDSSQDAFDKMFERDKEELRSLGVPIEIGNLDAYFDDEAMDLGRIPASEDFCIIPDALGLPYTDWGVGGFADWENAPGNHSPTFALDLQPTLHRTAEVMIVAAAAWLVDEDEG